MQSVLTRSRKNQVRPSRVKTTRLDMLDVLDNHCDHLAALAGLMEACGHHPLGEPLNRRLVADVGSLMLREVRQMRAHLDRLAKAAR